MTRMLMSSLVLVMFPLTASAGETTVTFQEGVGGYAGTADTQLNSADFDVSFGDAHLVAIDGVSGGLVDGVCDVDQSQFSCPDQGLLRFDAIFGSAENQIPLGSTIVSATLSVESSSAGGVTTDIHTMLQEWFENDTWDDWDAGIQADDLEALEDPDDLLGPVSLGVVTVDVTSSLQAWSDGDPNYGWVFLPGDNSNDGWVFFSSEEDTVSSDETQGGCLF